MQDSHKTKSMNTNNKRHRMDAIPLDRLTTSRLKDMAKTIEAYLSRAH